MIIYFDSLNTWFNIYVHMNLDFGLRKSLKGAMTTKFGIIWDLIYKPKPDVTDFGVGELRTESTYLGKDSIRSSEILNPEKSGKRIFDKTGLTWDLERYLHCQQKV